VVDLLREQIDGVPLSGLGPMVKPEFQDDEMTWLVELVNGLERDGLVTLAEEQAPYDASAIRVKLP
jgi:hypothetical protein